MRLSIVTPVYNREDCIIRCLESVTNQKGNIAIEHWIVDDGSTDNSYSIIKEYTNNHAHLKIHHFNNNKGVNAARNYAIAHSTGDFVLFLDSDDVLTESAVLTITKTIQENPNFLHYLFAVDARETYYQTNELLRKESCILTYENWIKKDAEGDFAHVIDRNMLVQYPFCEEFRIYEETVILKLYKHGKHQLFSHQIIMEKERGREDAVTKEYFLFHRKNIHAKSIAIYEIISSFYDDYIKYGEIEKVKKIIIKYLYLAIADENYGGYDNMILSKKVGLGLHTVLRKLRLGKLTRYGIILLSNIKNRNKKLE